MKEVCLEVVDELLAPVCRESVEDEKTYVRMCGLNVESLVLEV